MDVVVHRPRTGEADLNASATEETFLDGGWAAPTVADPANTDQARGARRLAGDASRVVLAVGVRDEWAAALRDSLSDCRFESRAFSDLDAAGSGSFLPTLVLVDATGPTGRAFLLELQAAPAGVAPVVEITADGEMVPGADATVDAAVPAADWVPLVRDLLR